MATWFLVLITYTNKKLYLINMLPTIKFLQILKFIFYSPL